MLPARIALVQKRLYTSANENNVTWLTGDRDRDHETGLCALIIIIIIITIIKMQ